LAAVIYLLSFSMPTIAHADGVTALVSAFTDLCVKTPPDFDALREKAKTLQLAPGSAPETWTLEKDGETFGLAAAREARQPRGTIDYCQIAASNMRGVDVREALTRVLQLNEAAAESVMKGTGDRPSEQITMWRKEVGRSWLTIHLRYAASGPFEIKLVSSRTTKFACVPGQKEWALDHADPAGSWSFAGPAAAIDGRTIDICGVKVSLDDIAAPLEADRLGADAKQKLNEYIGDGPVSCLENGKQADGGLKGFCLVGGGESLGGLMVKAGFAKACAPVHEKSEQLARQQQIGIWALSPTPELACAE
jgi:endonuclease YncB( thermonuclease family)